MYAVAGSDCAREMRMSVDAYILLMNVVRGKLQLDTSRTFISLAYRICAHRGNVYRAQRV